MLQEHLTGFPVKEVVIEKGCFYFLFFFDLPSISKYIIEERNLLKVVSVRVVILLSRKLNIRNRDIFSNGVPSMLHNLLLSI